MGHVEAEARGGRLTAACGHIVAFRLAGDPAVYALWLDSVLRVVRAVAIRPVRDVPSIVSGLINVAGEIVPVVDAHRLFGLPEHELELTDAILLARAHSRTVGLIVVEVVGVTEASPGFLVSADEAMSGPDGSIEGVMVTDDGMVLVYDLCRLLACAGGAPVAAFLQEGGGA